MGKAQANEEPRTRTALAVIEPRSFAILDPQNEMAMMVAENLQGEQVSEFDLDSVKVPSGGGLAWTVPTPEGEKTVDEIRGIIVHVGRRRQFWLAQDPTGEPPDCVSRDMVQGKGDPGGECDKCPHNEFGSSKNERGKACKEVRAVFMVREQDNMPIVVNIPPGSLKAFKQYLLRLPAPYFQVVTALRLKGDKNADGIKYSQVDPVLVAKLPQESIDRVRAYAKTLQESFK